MIIFVFIRNLEIVDTSVVLCSLKLAILPGHLRENDFLKLTIASLYILDKKTYLYKPQFEPGNPRSIDEI